MRRLGAQQQRKTQPEISCHRELTLGALMDAERTCHLAVSRDIVVYYYVASGVARVHVHVQNNPTGSNGITFTFTISCG